MGNESLCIYYRNGKCKLQFACQYHNGFFEGKVKKCRTEGNIINPRKITKRNEFKIN